MKHHLDEMQVTAVIAGEELEAEAQDHLASCLACRQEVAELQAMISERREQLETETPDWEGQRRAVLGRIAVGPVAGRRTRRWMRPLLAVAAVLLAAIGLREIYIPATPVSPGVETEFQIEEILAEVDAILADDSLPGFEAIDPGVEDPENIYDNGAS